MLEQNLPLQYQLKKIFLEKIKKQEWKQVEKIPSEREICAQYQVSRITVREVLKDLEREGYFSRKQGKGTFVTLPKYVQKLNKFYSFREMCIRDSFRAAQPAIAANIAGEAYRRVEGVVCKITGASTCAAASITA